MFQKLILQSLDKSLDACKRGSSFSYVGCRSIFIAILPEIKSGFFSGKMTVINLAIEKQRSEGTISVVIELSTHNN